MGTVQRSLEVPGESKFVDVWFTPAPTATEPSGNLSGNLGILSRIATTPCLLEPFRNAPTRQEIRSCLLKLLWIQEDQRRKIEQEGSTLTESKLPRLWILAATATSPVISLVGNSELIGCRESIFCQKHSRQLSLPLMSCRRLKKRCG